MQELELPAFQALACTFDAAVVATGGIDHYCSSSHWILPSLDAFHPDHEPWIYASSDNQAWAAMALGDSPAVGRFVAPLESMWGLATPFLGADDGRVAEEACEVLLRREKDWDALWLSGLRRDSMIFEQLVRTFGARYRMGLGPTTRRHVASLEGGWDGYLRRRSSSFRRNLRRSERMAAARPLRYHTFRGFDDHAAVAALYRRVLAIEARSWKGMADQGIDSGAMVHFYERMLPGLADAGHLRAIVATEGDGRDVGYVFGAIFADTFRGLQVSFDDTLRQMSLGNVMQARMIRLLCDEGVGFYDLGSDLPYKARWAEPGLETVTVAVLP